MQLWDKKDVFPFVKSTKSYLQKEIIRRSLTKNTIEPPRVKYWKHDICLKWLHDNAPHKREHSDILEKFDDLLEDMHEHYMECSGSNVANIWRQVRLYECILHSSLRILFRKRNDKKTRYELDARNSPNLPTTFYENVAMLFNSSEVLSSRNFSLEYGEPFQEKIYLRTPHSRYYVTKKSVKQHMTKVRGVFLDIKRCMKASGEGEGSLHGGSIRQFIKGHRGKKVVANGDATGYGFLAFVEENEMDNFLNVAPDSVSAGSSKSKSPKIGRFKKNQISLPSRKPRDNEDVMTFLRKMDRSIFLSDCKMKLDQTRFQISTEETSLLNHKNAIRSDRKDMREERKRLEEQGCSEYEIINDEDYQMACYNYSEGKKKMNKIVERIQKLEEEAENLEENYEKAKLNELDDTPRDGETHTKIDSTSKESFRNNDEKFGDDDGFEANVFSKVLFQPDEEQDAVSNDGSAPIDNLKIPREEHIE